MAIRIQLFMRATAPRAYIVRVRPPPQVSFSDNTARLHLEHWYESFLPLEPMSRDTGQPSLVHTYSGAAMTGFAARLTVAEAASVAAKHDVLGVFPSSRVPLHTTHSPEFLGLRAAAMYGGAWGGALSRMGEGVVVAVLDTMVNPNHVSFRDDGMGAPPAKWRGKCDLWGGRAGRCNKKIVGGRTMFQTFKDGHGTHTASTAAGNFVAGAGVLGGGNGTAAGMAPRAHLAVYEVCGDKGCDAADVLAGMDAAISDGADVLSLSFGDDRAKPFYKDAIAIGAFSAMQAVVKLGNGRTFVGQSAYQPHGLPLTELVTPVQRNSSDPECQPLTGVAGKIVVIEDVCDDMVQTGTLVKDAGGAGMLLTGEEEDGNTAFVDAHVLPASYLPYQDGVGIRKYMKSTKNPMASITFHGTSYSPSSAPAVASLSSRGPSLSTPGIVKPDIIGPGMNIIAAWPFKVGPKGEKDQARRGIGDFSDVTFNILSGTSMSTPHLSGIVALIKSEHPDWSPAMIKSAIMTTADTVRSDGKPIQDEKLNTAGTFDMGAGHVNPSRAVNPGLVYDIDEAQYIAYICGLGFTDEQVEIITHNKRGICQSTKKITGAELNYPSIVAQASAGNITVNRVSHGKYTVEINVPDGVVVEVSPSVLEFGGLNDKKIFNVKMSWDARKTKHLEGSLKWVSKTRVVRSPIVIFE
ncbi:unnamed protein product [Urochloa decumbens]|uniref:Uncharacterized protein n=1 Tax=Urochloa decumbens TaxID=240449 RepID=A0ABC9E8N0_9POAL